MSYIYKEGNKFKLKSTVLTIADMFDIEKLWTKNPQLFQELCDKYPLKTEQLYVIQCLKGETVEKVLKPQEEPSVIPLTEEKPLEVAKNEAEEVITEVVLNDKDRYYYHPESESYFILQKGEEFPTDSSFDYCVELSKEEYDKRTDANPAQAEEPKADFPEDFQPLYSIGEKLTITYKYGEVTEHIEIKEIYLETPNGEQVYYYKYAVEETGEVKTMGEKFLVEHEVINN